MKRLRGCAAQVAMLSICTSIIGACATSRPSAPAEVPTEVTADVPMLDQRFLAMGTQLTLRIALDDESRRPAAEAAVIEARQTLDAFGRDWWAWGRGALASINQQLAGGNTALIPAGMQQLFRRAWQIHLASGGRFEPRIGALVRLWGFDDIARLRSAPPPSTEIEPALAALHAAPAYEGGDSYGPASGITWDFGAIAKGYIVDQVLDRLRERGFGNALFDAGGNLAVRGQHGGQAWRVAIRDPRSDAQTAADAPQLLASLDARDEAVNTHGDDQRFFDYQGRRYAHILDPNTGSPVSGLRSLTVVAADGTMADAAGAALYVAGPRGWRALAEKLGLDQVLVVEDSGQVIVTAALASRLHFAPGAQVQVVR